MRRVWISRIGPPEVLQVREEPDPEPKRGEVRIRVKAAGINFADLMARMGLYPDAPKIPCVVGYEVSGVVDRLGEGVTRRDGGDPHTPGPAGFAEGDRVFGMPLFGGYTDTIALPVEQVIPMPAAMTFEEAAALPVVYITAYHMMIFTGNLRQGSRVLIHSAAGGVGLAAIQLAKTRDCTIFGTASRSKHGFLREQGVKYPIDSQGDYVAAVREGLVAEGAADKGLDLVLDPVGGRSWTEGYDLLGPAGRLVAFGLSAASAGKQRSVVDALGALLRIKRWSPTKLMDDNKTVAGVNMGHMFNRLDLLRPQFDALLALYGEGKIKPHVDRTFPFAEVAAAHHHIHDRKATGKVLLVP